jgi:cellulose synthase/poly-beta-1,6-N-acetylglucosamine synthase-like glycosyltransferase
MTTTIPIILLAALTLYYVYFIGRLPIGLKRIRRSSASNQIAPMVSVVIAARNEEQNIEACLRSVVDQDYPVGRFEVIFVNDGSTDNTDAIVTELSSNHKNIRILTLPADSGHRAGRKPVAIAAGIEIAKGEIILTTDADCRVPKSWISCMVGQFDPETGFVAGPVHEVAGNSFIAKLDRLELLGLISTAAGLIGLGKPITCNGANLAYRKTAFLAAQGYGEKGSWCDDETLMHRIHIRGLGRISFSPYSECAVTTRPNNSMGSFWKQRLRWSAKGGHFESISVLLSLVGLYSYFFFLLLLFVISIQTPELRPWVVISLAVKCCVDFITLSAGAQLFQQHIQVPVFLIAELFHVPYIVVTAAVGQFISLEWKGRRIPR